MGGYSVVVRTAKKESGMSKINDALNEAQAKQAKWGNAWDEYRIATLEDIIRGKVKRMVISHDAEDWDDYYDSLADLKCYTDELIKRLDKE